MCLVSTPAEMSLKARLRAVLRNEVAPVASQTRNWEKNKWAKRAGHFLACPSTMMSAEAVPIGHHDKQGVTLGESSASTARHRDHVLYLVWR
jgi:hypothetical protein